MTTLQCAQTLPVSQFGLTLVPLHDELWRVTRADGEVVGYIERFRERQGMRYRAKRLHVLRRQFVVDGEFWTIDAARECFFAG
jgi:hypothetical protein